MGPPWNSWGSPKSGLRPENRVACMSLAADQPWTGPFPFQPEESFALEADAADPLRVYRDRFLLPRRANGQPLIYFCGHSLGLQPLAARALVEQELDAWAGL